MKDDEIIGLKVGAVYNVSGVPLRPWLEGPCKVLAIYNSYTDNACPPIKYSGITWPTKSFGLPQVIIEYTDADNPNSGPFMGMLDAFELKAAAFVPVNIETKVKLTPAARYYVNGLTGHQNRHNGRCELIGFWDHLADRRCPPVNLGGKDNLWPSKCWPFPQLAFLDQNGERFMVDGSQLSTVKIEKVATTRNLVAEALSACEVMMETEDLPEALIEQVADVIVRKLEDSNMIVYTNHRNYVGSGW